jgi:hypothetical protein
MNLTVTGVLETGEPRRPGVPTNQRTTITIQQGTSLVLMVPIVRPDGSSYTPVTGDSVVWSVKKKPTDNPPLISKLATIVAGSAVFTLLPADTKQMDAGRYTWDVWLNRAGTPVTRDAVIPQSALVLEASVTPVP